MIDTAKLAEIEAQVELDFEYNIVVLGARRVGKTSFIQSIVRGQHVQPEETGDSLRGASMFHRERSKDARHLSLDQELVRHQLDLGD